MAYNRTPEEMKKIHIHVAGMVACKKEKKEIYNYLKEQGYKNPTDQYTKMTQPKDYQRILEQARQMRVKMGNSDPIDMEPIITETEPEKIETVVLNGTEFTRMKPEDLPATNDEAPVILETAPITLDTVPNRTEPSETIQEDVEEEKTDDEEITSAPMPDEEYVQQLMETFGADHVEETDDVASAFDNSTEAVNNLAGAINKTFKKPPLGLMPKYVWIRLRIKEILKAMARYHDAGMITPLAWIEELAELEDFSAEIFTEDKERDAE